jgi:hypothetical protein
MTVLGKRDGREYEIAEEENPLPIGQINWRIVDSSNVLRVGWDTMGNMYVKFISGETYLYFDVPRQRAVAAAYSTSVGGYINNRIKGNYEYLKIQLKRTGEEEPRSTSGTS